MNEAKTKSQIVEKITSSTNVLVTVSNNPSVDALSAAIALTLILNKLGKHTTAIFSGATPPAITFLDPGKTFEASIDSLRDFIIALDKEKADHLRYKVEGDAVKIFITPYRTTISSEDLEFSQGDYNVELVLALGVENQTHLDSALEAHGSILHDATVITISTGEGSSSLGSIDWRDETASSLSEMLVGLSETLQTEAPLIDQEIATALLTGIVAETDRFSNTKTSSKVMTIAAQLMGAGADQQLIAAKLQESHEIGAGALPSGNDSPYTATLAQSGVPLSTPIKEGMAITHDAPAVVIPVQPPVAVPVVPLAAVTIVPPAPMTVPDAPAPMLPPVIGKIADAYALDPDMPAEPIAAPTVQPLLGGVASSTPAPVLEPVPLPPAVVQPAPLPPPMPPVAPAPVSLGMTEPLQGPLAPPIEPISAPMPAAAPLEEISKHSYLGDAPTYGMPTTDTIEQPAVDIFAAQPPAPAADAFTPPADKSRDEASRDDALAAVNAAYGGVAPSVAPALGAFSPAPGITLPPPPPLPDFGALPTPAAASPYALDTLPQPAPERLGDILGPPSQPVSNDPGQFKIPGQ